MVGVWLSNWLLIESIEIGAFYGKIEFHGKLYYAICHFTSQEAKPCRPIHRNKTE
jgi:hypothetical protein